MGLFTDVAGVLLRRNVKRFRGGLVFKVYRLVYLSTLGLRVPKKQKKWLAFSNLKCRHGVLFLNVLTDFARAVGHTKIMKKR